MGNIFIKTFQSCLWKCSSMVMYVYCMCLYFLLHYFNFICTHEKSGETSSSFEFGYWTLWYRIMAIILMPLFCLFPSFIRVNAVLQLVFELQAHVQTNIETFAKTRKKKNKEGIKKCQAANFYIYLPHVCVILLIVLVNLDNGNKLNDMLSL